MIGNFYTYVKDGNISEVRRLLNIKAINLDRTVGIKALAIAVDNCQKKVFAELLKYPIDIYVKTGNIDVTILHILVSHLNFATLYPDKAKKICNMIRILLKTEAESRIKNPQDYWLFLEQTPSASGKVPIPSIEAKAFSDLRNKINNIISEIETSYPEIVNLKAQAKAIANEHRLIADIPVAASITTLTNRRHVLSGDEKRPLLLQKSETPGSEQNTDTWNAFWNKLFSLISNYRNVTDCESSVMKSR